MNFIFNRYSVLTFLCILLLVCFISFSIDCVAVPAKPGITKFRQPNGEYVDIIIYGDERGHFITTDDGYILSELNDALYFSEFDKEKDKIQPSGFLAKNSLDRDLSTGNFLKTLDKIGMIQKCRNRLFNARKHVLSSNKSTTSSVGAFGLFPDSSYPLNGEQRGVVILVEFSDVKFNTHYDPRDYFSRMLNESGFSDIGGTGSAREYFIENSRGKFRPYFDVYGPVMLNKPMMYYGANDIEGRDMNPAAMIIEACTKLDEEVDFTKYDRDSDGVIDNVFVFYAGRGEASGGSPSTIWPHSWDIRSAVETPLNLDGKVLGKYACTNEWQGEVPDGIGTFVHEFSHILGLPDLYATSYTEAFTPGQWSVMDYGSYNNSSRTPPMYSGFERFALGWSEAPEIKGNRIIEMNNILNDDGYVLSTSADNEKYFIEYRQQKGWDSYLPNSGMLLWHVNYNVNVWNQNSVNNDPERQYVDLIEAGGDMKNESRSFHSFPGTGGIFEFSEETHPAIVSWNDKEFYLRISNIVEKNNRLSAKVSTSGCEILHPENIFITNISDKSVTVSWSEVENATDYILSVYEHEEGVKKKHTTGFDEGLKNMGGWSTNSMTLSQAENNVGEKAPSLTFLRPGGFVESPMMEESISSFSFWCKAFSESTPLFPPEIIIYIKKVDSNDWEEYATYTPILNSKGKRVNYENLPEEVKSIRLWVKGISGVVYYVDDCEIEYGSKSVFKLLPDYPMHLGHITSYAIGGLKPEFSGAVSIIATEGEIFSDESGKILFTTLKENSGINSVEREDDISDKEYYTLGGIRVTNPSKGIYISRKGIKIIN